jgi:hypothetical protein
MRIAKAISVLGLLAMTAVLVFGFVVGDFSSDGENLLANPWGIVSLVDLYVGFALFSAWIVFREKSAWSIVWVFLMMVLGFFTASLYVLIALYKSDGDWVRFFMGRRKEKKAHHKKTTDYAKK